MLYQQEANPHEMFFHWLLGCLLLKSLKVGNNTFESASDLSSSGDFAFFLATMSGRESMWSLLKNDSIKGFRGGSLRCRIYRHKDIGDFVGTIRIIKVISFSISVKLFDNVVDIFRVVFRHISFNTRKKCRIRA